MELRDSSKLQTGERMNFVFVLAILAVVIFIFVGTLRGGEAK